MGIMESIPFTKEYKKNKLLEKEAKKLGFKFVTPNNKTLRMYFDAHLKEEPNEVEYYFLKHIIEMKTYLYYNNHYDKRNLININDRNEIIFNDIIRINQIISSLKEVKIVVTKGLDPFFVNNFHIASNNTIYVNEMLFVNKTPQIGSIISINDNFLYELKRTKTIRIFLKQDENIGLLFFVLHIIIKQYCQSVNKLIISQVELNLFDEQIFGVISKFIVDYPNLNSIIIETKSIYEWEEEGNEENENEDEEGEEENEDEDEDEMESKDIDSSIRSNDTNKYLHNKEDNVKNKSKFSIVSKSDLSKSIKSKKSTKSYIDKERIESKEYKIQSKSNLKKLNLSSKEISNIMNLKSEENKKNEYNGNIVNKVKIKDNIKSDKRRFSVSNERNPFQLMINIDNIKDEINNKRFSINYSQFNKSPTMLNQKFQRQYTKLMKQNNKASSKKIQEIDEEDEENKNKSESQLSKGVEVDNSLLPGNQSKNESINNKDNENYNKKISNATGSGGKSSSKNSSLRSSDHSSSLNETRKSEQGNMNTNRMSITQNLYSEYKIMNFEEGDYQRMESNSLRNRQYLFIFFQSLALKNNLLELRLLCFIYDYSLIQISQIIKSNPNLRVIDITNVLNEFDMGKLNNLEINYESYNKLGSRIKDEVFILFNCINSLKSLHTLGLKKFFFNSDINYLACQSAILNPKLIKLDLSFNQSILSNEITICNMFNFCDTNLSHLYLGRTYFNMMRRWDVIISDILYDFDAGIIDYISLCSLLKYLSGKNITRLKVSLNRSCDISSMEFLFRLVSFSLKNIKKLKRFTLINAYSEESLFKYSSKIEEYTGKYFIDNLRESKSLNEIIFSEKSEYISYFKEHSYIKPSNYNKALCIIILVKNIFFGSSDLDKINIAKRMIKFLYAEFKTIKF